MKKETQTWYLNVKNLNPWAYIEKFLTEEECKRIINYGNNLKIEEGQVGENNFLRLDSSIRKSKIAFLNSSDSELEWIYRKITDAINYVNLNFYEFNLDYIETLQFSTYTNINDYYGPHIDTMFNNIHHRKLSFSIQLSDPSDYAGGELKIGLGEKNASKNGQGDIIFFPSFMVHEVTPVEYGQRYSLVGWVCGPRFK